MTKRLLYDQILIPHFDSTFKNPIAGDLCNI